MEQLPLTGSARACQHCLDVEHPTERHRETDSARGVARTIVADNNARWRPRRRMAAHDQYGASRHADNPVGVSPEKRVR